MKHLLLKLSYQKKMVLCFCFLVSLCQIVQAQSYRSKVITLKANNERIKSILNEISKSTDIKFFYNNQQIDVEKKITIVESKLGLENALKAIFPNNDVEFKFEENTILLLKRNPTNDKKKVTIKGKILDEQNNPVIGAVVCVEGSNNRVATNMDGEFTLSTAIGDKVKVTFIGYKTEIKTITNNTSNITIFLKENAVTLDDVVVTGYQRLSKERATGSFTTLSKEKLDKRMQMDITSKLEGMVPGLISYNGYLEIRGQSTLIGNADPLYVIDGFPFEGSLSSISPSEIESVTVLKDAAAASIYGARSANGVIVITTKMGSDKKTDVEYNSNITFNFLQDQRKYLNLMNSSEFIDFQKEMFNVYHPDAASLDSRTKRREIEGILYRHEAGSITEEQMEAELDVYRNRDNRNDYNKLGFMRKSSWSQQHNVSVRGGSDKYKYSINANYRRSDPYDKDRFDDRLGYDAKGSYQFFKWLKVDLNILGSFTSSEDKGLGFSPTYMYTGGGEIPSYRTIWDQNGNEQRWDFFKSDAEIERLKGIGLFDESKYPLKERQNYTNTDKSNYSKVNLGLNAKIIDGLTFDLKFQTETGNGLLSNITLKNALSVREKVNNSSIYDEVSKKLTLNIPYGGIIKETRSIQQSYTLRAQLNYNKTFKEIHGLSIIAGAERRNVLTSSTYSERYGYDPVSLSYKAIDEKLLNTTISGTESLLNAFALWPNGGVPRSFYENLNRYVSFYANAGYTYDSKYDVSASIRMDQSNLFGTDPKLQYRPLWSFGFGWHIAKESFMKNIDWVNQLTFRATKGINGNIPKEGGPYMIAQYAGLNSWTGDYSSFVSSPPNSGLRWERTDQTNIGINYSLFGNRVSGSLEYYSKNTSDLLGNRAFDSTSGWKSLTVNYASMYNRGVEFVLNTCNIQTAEWNWSTLFNFSYNKNMITKLENSENSVSSYIDYTNVRVGMPIGTIYSVRWAGLNENGRPMAFKKDGTRVGSIADLTAEDLVESGTHIPPYALSLSNDLSYKGVGFSFMLMMYTGNKMRDAVQPIITKPENYLSYGNQNRDLINYWKPGMSINDASLIPGIYRNASDNITKIWSAADKHILNAGYLSLKEINISYSFPKSILRPLKMTNLTIRGQIENLAIWAFNSKGLNPFTWDGRDLSPSRGYETSPVYSLGLSVKF